MSEPIVKKAFQLMAYRCYKDALDKQMESLESEIKDLQNEELKALLMRELLRVTAVNIGATRRTEVLNLELNRLLEE